MRTVTSATDRNRQAGFTLVELLAVLAIMALAAAAFSFNGARGTETAAFRAFLVNTAAALGDARATAMKTGAETPVTIDAANRSISSGSKTIEVPAKAVMTATAAATGAQSIAEIRFFADGTSTGGLLAFDHQGRTFTISVNWLTGHVALKET